jgi:hypothetical protein
MRDRPQLGAYTCTRCSGSRLSCDQPWWLSQQSQSLASRAASQNLHASIQRLPSCVVLHDTHQTSSTGSSFLIVAPTVSRSIQAQPLLLSHHGDDEQHQHRNSGHYKLHSRTDVGAGELDVSSGQGVKLDHLGPMVVKRDGTLSRVANWEQMADIERRNTLRILGKRNQLRMAALRAEEDERAAK